MEIHRRQTKTGRGDRSQRCTQPENETGQSKTGGRNSKRGNHSLGKSAGGEEKGLTSPANKKTGKAQIETNYSEQVTGAKKTTRLNCDSDQILQNQSKSRKNK
jgi:hypothetical protein